MRSRRLAAFLARWRLDAAGARRITAFLAVLAFAGCSSRDHVNPFDPGNLVTEGEPRLVSAAAGDGRVGLTWSVPEFTDLEVVRMVRIDESGNMVVLDV